MTDYVKKKGAAALGTRLRRLSEHMDRQIQQVYGAYDLSFEPRWFPMVSVLSDYGVLSVGDLAELIGVSHAAVSQLRAELVNARLIRCKADPSDGRRQLIALTPRGTRQVGMLRPIWDAITRATIQLCIEAAPDFLDAIGRIESALTQTPMEQRVRALRPAYLKHVESTVVRHG